MTLKDILSLTASDGCEQPKTSSSKYDPFGFVLVEQAAFDALMNIIDGKCERFDFPMIEPGIDRRTRSSCIRFKSGDAVIEVMVNVIEDTKRRAAT